MAFNYYSSDLISIFTISSVLTLPPPFLSKDLNICIEAFLFIFWLAIFKALWKSSKVKALNKDLVFCLSSYFYISTSCIIKSIQLRPYYRSWFYIALYSFLSSFTFDVAVGLLAFLVTLAKPWSPSYSSTCNYSPSGTSYFFFW